MPDDNMGHPDNITNDTIRKAAKAFGQSEQDAKKNMLELLKQEVGDK